MRRQGLERRGLSLFAGRYAILVCAVCACVLGPCSQTAGAAITRSGTLQATVLDDFQSGRSETRYRLRSGEREIVLQPTELAAEPGDRVTVTGELRGDRLAGTVRATSGSARAQTISPGPRKTAVLLFSFSGESAEPWPLAESRSEVFTAANSVSAFYEEESYGNISLTGKLRPDGDVFGWLSVDTPTAGCPFEAWRNAAAEAAASAGIDLSGYQHVIYEFPHQSSCGNVLGLAALDGDWVMINGNFFGTRRQTTIHELGHNLGLLHAGSWTCTAGGERVQISDTCSISEYGDPFDAMGNISMRHNSGWNLAKLGILKPENVETVESSGTYSLHSALSPTSEPTVLRIPRKESVGGNITSWYYLEIRKTGGVFENVTDASTTGISIRATAEGSSPETLLLDANPATATFQDAPLGVGETFEGGPVKFKTLSAGGGVASVAVELDEEPPSKPDVQATVGADGVRLSWTSTDDVGVARYFVFRDGEQVGNVTTPSFLDGRAPAGDHEYTVVAEDESHNQSEPSDPLIVPVPLVSGPDCSEGRCKLAYRYSGAPASWTVPPGVGDAFLTVEGASGGGAFGGPERGPGSGARIWATLEPLTAGQVAEISIGEKGEPYSAGGGGGLNGGGDGGLGGGGGGYTAVKLESALQVLAAGGGGGGLDGANGGLSPAGGRGGSGGEQGSNGTAGAQTIAQGATLRGGGAGGRGGASGSAGAGGGVLNSSGCAGGAHAGASGAGGASFAGGGEVANAGGGGGGGYVGGGQGGAGAGDECGATAASGGGGGGSSFVAPGHLNGFDTAGDGDGWLSIEYDNPIDLTARNYTTEPNQALVVPAASGLLAGASAPDEDPLSPSVVIEPAHGSLSLGADGSFTYAPDPGYAGADSFIYRASDSAGDYATTTVTLTVAKPPSASISTPLDGGTYVLEQVVNASFTCAEGPGGPGISSCAGPVADDAAIDTSTVGSHRFTVTAASQDGLEGQATVAYTVEAAPVAEVPGSPPIAESPTPSSPPPLALAIETARAPVVHGRVRVALSCSGGAPGSACEGTLSLPPARTLYRVESGRTRPIAVRLSAATLRRLGRAPAHSLRVRATATEVGGQGSSRALVLRLDLHTRPSAGSTVRKRSGPLA